MAFYCRPGVNGLIWHNEDVPRVEERERTPRMTPDEIVRLLDHDHDAELRECFVSGYEKGFEEGIEQGMHSPLVQNWS